MVMINMTRKYWFFFLLFFAIASFGVAQENEEDEDELIEYPPNAILVASYMGNMDLVRNILDAGVDTDYRSVSGATALHMAMLQRNPALIKLLLDYGFNPNAKDTKDGYTPLHMAVVSNNADAIRLLLQYKADRNIRSLAGLTPLEKARREDKTELVRLLQR